MSALSYGTVFVLSLDIQDAHAHPRDRVLQTRIEAEGAPVPQATAEFVYGSGFGVVTVHGASNTGQPSLARIACVL